jgi:hypothetical protein
MEWLPVKPDPPVTTIVLTVAILLSRILFPPYRPLTVSR